MRRPVTRVDEQAQPVGLHGVGDPHLAAVDDVVVAVLARGGLDRGDVRAGATARSPRSSRRARPRSPARGTPGAARRCPSARARASPCRSDADRHGQRAAGAVAELLGEGDRERVVEPQAAELLGLGDAEQAELAELPEHLVRGEISGGLPGVDVRVQSPVRRSCGRSGGWRGVPGSAAWASSVGSGACEGSEKLFRHLDVARAQPLAERLGLRIEAGG